MCTPRLSFFFTFLNQLSVKFDFENGGSETYFSNLTEGNMLTATYRPVWETT